MIRQGLKEKAMNTWKNTNILLVVLVFILLIGGCRKKEDSSQQPNEQGVASQTTSEKSDTGSTIDNPELKSPSDKSTPTETALTAPANLRAHTVSGRKTVQLGEGQSLSRAVAYVEVSWDPVSGADSYNLYWSQSPNLTKATGALIRNVTSPYEHDIKTGAEVYYRVATVKDNKESELSQEASATAPTGFVQY
jgi:hypothetical protein